jgi:Holliday junction resolvasome RuvABC DNA-binding subunit
MTKHEIKEMIVALRQLGLNEKEVAYFVKAAQNNKGGKK